MKLFRFINSLPENFIEALPKGSRGHFFFRTKTKLNGNFFATGNFELAMCGSFRSRLRGIYRSMIFVHHKFVKRIFEEPAGILRSENFLKIRFVFREQKIGKLFICSRIDRKNKIPQRRLPGEH